MPTLLHEQGPSPFVTRRVWTLPTGGRQIWSSRHERKGLVLAELARAESVGKLLWRSLWMPRQLNWWIGAIFAIGASLFAIASLFVLWPSWGRAAGIEPQDVNVLYFAGSLPFTTAAWLQLFQAANSVENQTPSNRLQLIGWKPRNVGWLSCFLQWMGTVLFNFNTYDAMQVGTNWLALDFTVWLPNFAGSVLFLVSGYLAFIEVCHAYWSWHPRELSWWVVAINLLGCIGFMVSAFCSLVLPGETEGILPVWGVAFTLQGAICFFLGALLLLPETAREAEIL